MQKLLNVLSQNGIQLSFLELDYPGYYCHEGKMIIVNQNQSDEEIISVIYHELKHALDHSDYVTLYRNSIHHLKMESEADDYMIRRVIEENGGVYNYSQLVEEFNIRMGKEIKYAN